MQENEHILYLAFFHAIFDAAEVFIKLTILVDRQCSAPEHFKFFPIIENFNITSRLEHFGLPRLGGYFPTGLSRELPILKW